MTSPTPFAYYDPESCCWKTSQGTFPWASDEYSETWPRSGSMRSGAASARPRSAPRTAANASPWPPGLPTPRARDWKRGGKDGLEQALLPTPRASDTGTPGRRASEDLMLPAAVQPSRFGVYTSAIRRWEHVLGRPAPAPTEPGTKGQPRLNAAFVEWLMGLDAGWVTNHLPRNPALRCLGNGVVPHQAAHALADLLTT